MFARLSIYENVNPNLAEQVRQWVESLGTDPFGELPGYRGSMMLVDRDKRADGRHRLLRKLRSRARGDTVLKAMPERVRAEVPDDIRPALDMQPESVGFYDVVHRD